MEAMVPQETLPAAEAVVSQVCSTETLSKEMVNHSSSLVQAVVLVTEKVVPVVEKPAAKAKEVETVEHRLLVEPEAKVSMVLISLVEMETPEDNKHKAAGLMAQAVELVTSVEKVANPTLLLVAVVLVTATHNAQANASSRWEVKVLRAQVLLLKPLIMTMWTTEMDEELVLQVPQMLAMGSLSSATTPATSLAQPTTAQSLVVLSSTLETLRPSLYPMA